MKKKCLALAALLCVVSVGQDLRSVKRIYIDSLGDDTGANAIRNGIAHELAKSGRFELVDAADQSDAVLGGEGHMTKTRDHNKTRYHASASLQLKSKDQTVLWSKDDSSDSISNKTSITLGHELARKLEKAAAVSIP